jgi:hypothetical protein
VDDEFESRSHATRLVRWPVRRVAEQSTIIANHTTMTADESDRLYIVSVQVC